MLATANGLLYVGLALLLGGAFTRRVLTPAHPGLWVLILGLGLIVSGAGLTLWSALAAVGLTSPSDLLASLTQLAAGRALLVMLIGALALLAAELSAWPARTLLVAAAVTLWGVAGAGHGGTHGPTVRLLHATHAGAMCVWLGGVLALATWRGAGPDDARRFTPIATTSVSTLAVTGVFATLEHAGRLWGVWESEYGRVLLVKLAVMTLTLLSALWSRQALARTRSVRQALGLEVALLVAVLGVTSVLSQTAPPTHDMEHRQMDGR